MKVMRVLSKRLGFHVWAIDVTIGNRRVRRAGFTTKKEALDAIAALRLRHRAKQFGYESPRPEITCGQLLKQLEKDRAFLNQRTHSRGLVRQFLSFVGLESPLTAISESVFRRFIDKLQGQGLQANTINTYLCVVGAMLNLAGKHFNTTWRHPRLPMLKPTPGRTRVLTQSEIGKLLPGFAAPRLPRESHKGHQIRILAGDLFRLALLTAAREGELLNLPASAYNADWQTLTIYASKTNSVRVVPLSAPALAIVKKRLALKQKTLFPMRKNPLYRAVAKAAALANVAYGDTKENGFVFYATRHTAATVMGELGASYAAIADVMGHKMSGMTRHYQHASLKSKREAIELLARWCLEIENFAEQKNDAEILTGRLAVNY